MTHATKSILSVAITSDGHDLLLAPCGELDWETVSTLVHCLEDVVEAGCSQVRVDLSGISFLDVAGYRALVEFGECCHRRGIVGAWLRPSRSVQLVFDILGQPRTQDFDEVDDSGRFDGVRKTRHDRW
jgi:anti-anti-sigma factor